MKKHNIMALLLASMVFAACEKLPKADDYSVPQPPPFETMDGFTTKNSAYIYSYYNIYHYMQFSDTPDFVRELPTEKLNDAWLVIKNLKPATTYYYRLVSTDVLGGVKTGEVMTFRTQNEDFQLLSAQEVESRWDTYPPGHTLTLRYGITNFNFPNSLISHSAIAAKLFYQASSDGDVRCEEYNNRYIEDLTFSLYTEDVGSLTYWVVLYNNNTFVGLNDGEVLYQSPKKTIDIPNY
jgi:hypothetical protein